MRSNTDPANRMARATDLQRRDGSRPVGNSSNRKGRREKAIPHPTPNTCPTVRGAGSEFDATTRA